MVHRITQGGNHLLRRALADHKKGRFSVGIFPAERTKPQSTAAKPQLMYEKFVRHLDHLQA